MDYDKYEKRKRCDNCKYRSYDMDGEFCVHPEVLKRMPWGAALWCEIPECPISDELIDAGKEHPLHEARNVTA